jgi:beta-lactam-binding protein with PASTA domain
VKRLALIGLLLPGLAAADTFMFAGGAFTRLNDAAQVAVPDVVGEASPAAADAILEAALLDLGEVGLTCSAAAEDEVLSQNPAVGATVDEGSLVDIVVSNGVVCTGSGGGRRRGLGLGL